MRQVSSVMIESVQPMSTVPETTFLVRGDSMHGAEMKTYCIVWILELKKPLSLSALFCFAVIGSGYREFEDLIAIQRNHSLHTIDRDLFKSENDDIPLVRKILFQRLIIICAFINCNLGIIFCRFLEYRGLVLACTHKQNTNWAYSVPEH